MAGRAVQPVLCIRKYRGERLLVHLCGRLKLTQSWHCLLHLPQQWAKRRYSTVLRSSILVIIVSRVISLNSEASPTTFGVSIASIWPKYWFEPDGRRSDQGSFRSVSYSSVVLQEWEIFIEMRAACFVPSFLKKVGYRREAAAVLHITLSAAKWLFLISQ